MKAGDAGEAGFLRVVQGRLADPVRLAAMRAEVGAPCATAPPTSSA